MSRSRLRATVVTNRSRAMSGMRRSHSQSAFRRRSRRRVHRPCGLCRRRGGSLARRSTVPRVFSTWLRRRRRRVTRPTALTPTRPGIAGLQQLDLETYLPGDLLPKADLASMAHSLELRSPFLDHEVVALGLALPDSLKVRGREGKVALRRAFADLLPAEVTTRGKTGFGVPLGRWFRSDLREVAHDLLPSERGWFR